MHTEADRHDVIALEGVTVAYRTARNARLVVIDGCDLRVPAGQFVCVSGRSGSGKTTLLNTAAGHISPDSGSVRWRGTAIERLSAGDRSKRRQGFLAQTHQGSPLVSSLTARENVLAAVMCERRPRRADTERADDLLDRLGVGSRARAFPHQLSGGEQQRVAIARALMAAASVLLADEPTANLDRASADEVIELLGSLPGEHDMSVIVASHDPALVTAADLVVDLD